MKKVVSINLNGHAYQIDEDAYEQLAAYLDRADRDLHDNPDRAEILADLEQAIADKCERHLGPHRSVISADDVAKILAEMGPVDTGEPRKEDSEKAAPHPPDAGTAPRRLYRIMDGAWVGGICNGLAAYLNVDPTVVRATSVVLTALELLLFHTSLSPLVYIALWFLIPEASTSEERAAAAGLPFNARAVIERAKKDANAHYRRFNRAAERRRYRFERRWARMAGTPPYFWQPLGYAGRMTTAALLPVLTFTSVLAFWSAVFVALSFAVRGSFYHWSLPDDVPLWIGIATLSLVYFTIAWPLQLARKTAYFALSGSYHGWVEAADGLLWVVMTMVVVWFAYHQFPAVREVVDQVPELWRRLAAWIARQ